VQSSRILVVTSSWNMKRTVLRSLVSAGFEVTVCLNNRAEVERALASRPGMCIVDAGGGWEEVQWLIDLLYNQHQEVIPLFTSQDHTSRIVRDSLTAKNLNNLIAMHGGVTAMGDHINETELVVTCQKLLRRDIFGLEKYLSTWGIRIDELEIRGTESKPVILRELEGFLDQLDCYRPIRNAVLLVADELVMNAIFNAPRDSEGRPRYVAVDRSKDLVLEPHERAVLRYACDGRYIALSVRDPFGSLGREVLVSYLQHYFDEGPAAMENKPQGAGLGLYMVLSSITQLTFNIQEGVATEVIAVFYIAGKRAFQSAEHSLNLFYIRGARYALPSRRVLLVTSNRQTRRTVRRSLVSAGFDVQDCPMARADIELALEQRPEMCIMDAANGGEDVQWLIDLLYREHQEVIPLLASQDHASRVVGESLTTRNLNNLIAKRGAVSATSGDIDETELVVTCQKLLQRDIFGFEKYLSTWGIQIRELEIRGTESKPSILREVETFLDRLSCFKPVKHAVMLVADELVMNAIFNAPRDSEGRPKYADLDRSTDVTLEPQERGLLRYACDGRNIALSVRDPFGSLDRDVLVHYLRHYFEGEPQIKEGAGLGLYMVLNSITQLTFNIEAGVATEVIAMFYVHGGSMAFQSSGRSLNLFYLS
jgi:DNA-binding response OmpR family regulator